MKIRLKLLLSLFVLFTEQGNSAAAAAAAFGGAGSSSSSEGTDDELMATTTLPAPSSFSTVIPVENTFYYTATNEKTGVELRILGSCHSLSLDCIAPTIVDRLSASQILFTEFHVDLSKVFCSLLSPYSLDELSKNGIYLEKSIEAKYPEDIKAEIFRKYDNRFQKQWRKSVFMFHPCAVKFLLERSISYAQSVSVKGMDSELEEIFKDKDKQVFGLETVRERSDNMKILNMGSQENSADYQVYFEKIKELNEKHDKALESKKKYDCCVSAIDTHNYMSGNERRFASMSSFDESAQRRNLSWAEKLIKHLEDHKDINVASVVVGVAHLPGPKGLLRLLEKNGFTIMRGITE